MTQIVKKRTAGGARTLDGRFVTSREIFQREKFKIFATHWLCAGRVSELERPGRLFTVQLVDSNLLVVADGDEIRCFHNVCRHRGSLLVHEDSECGRIGSRIQCPYHAWTYSRSGELVAAPNMEEGSFDFSEHGLKPVACRVALGFVWVRLGQSGVDFDDFFRPLIAQVEPWSLDDLMVVRRIEYVVRANWKLLFQNYSECYHCPGVHPALNRLTPFLGSSNELSEGPILGGPMRLADDCQSMSADGCAVGKFLPGLDRQQLRSVVYYTVFPSTFISLHPDYVLIHRIQPVSERETKVSCEFLFSTESIHSNTFDPGPAVTFWDQTNLQDWQVCELTQQGMSADGYEPGPYSGLESIVAAFDRYYLSQI